MFDYDVAVIGAGPAGCACAQKSAALGLKTALIEKDRVGGTCLHRGCIPTKALIQASELYYEMSQSQSFGIVGTAQWDMAKLTAYRDEAVTLNYQGLVRKLAKSPVVLLKGSGFVKDNHTIEIMTDDGMISLSASYIVLAVGTSPALLNVPGGHMPEIMTSDDLLMRPMDAPTHMTIVGGGVVGLELAGIYASLGSAVVILEEQDELLPFLDSDVLRHVRMSLNKQGIEWKTGVKISSVKKTDKGLLVCYDDAGLETACVVSAVGRKTRLDDLTALPLKTDDGRILTDRDGRTSEPGLYAIGDAASKIRLAPWAEAMGERAAEAIYRDIKGGTDDKSMENAVAFDGLISPETLFLRPEVAFAGLGEREALKAGYRIAVGKCRFDQNSMAVIRHRTEGFVKLIFDSDTKRLLGAQIVGAEASLLIDALTLAIEEKLTYDRLRRQLRCHPSLNEAISDALKHVAF